MEPLFTERYRQEGSSTVLDKGFLEHASANIVDLAQILSQLGLSVSPAVEKDEEHLIREEL
jgi:hypothetical protein